MSYRWTAAQSCLVMEGVATDLIREAGDQRETLRRQRELEAIRLRSAFKLIINSPPKMGFEQMHWRVAEHFEQYESDEVRNLLDLDGLLPEEE